MCVYRQASSLALLAVLLSLCGSSVAQAQTQSDMAASATDSARKVTASLETAVKTYRQRLSKAQRGLFDHSQRAWEAFRKSACEFEASGVRGGSAEGTVRTTCWETYTAQRLKRIREMAECAEGDLSCPAFKHGT